MKRLERLGSIAFLTITISFIFHLIAMSFEHWIVTECTDCNQTNPLAVWRLSLLKRCYRAPVGSIFLTGNQTNANLDQESFKTEFCIPNQYLTYRQPNHALDCLLSALNYPHLVCALSVYNPNYCRCNVSVREKVVVVMTTFTAIILAVTLIFSHIVTLARFNYILKWLLPTSLILLCLAAILIIVSLATTGTHLREDLNQIVYMTDLVSTAFQNETLATIWNDYINEKIITNQYTVRVGWCFGLEIIALQFTVVSLIIYALMLVAKDRPE